MSLPSSRVGALLAAAMVAVTLVTPSAAGAQTGAGVDGVSIVPAAGTQVTWNGRGYAGTLHVSAHSDGLALVEEIDLDGYLAGINEVPLTWPEEALAAQVVAARTYLAWTLQRGRSDTGARYGFDICATTACQVYSGVGLIRGADGHRWQEAIARTSGEVLLYEGAPAQAMYHSTSGGRTEPIGDVFAGASPRPYLRGAASPGEESPYVGWAVELPAAAFVTILVDGGISVQGELVDVTVPPRPQGEGVWQMRVETTEGVVTLPVADVRRIFNRHGPSRFPGLLPGPRPDGRRYPQAILSYRFATTYTPPEPGAGSAWARLLPADDRPSAGRVRIAGNGWGHHVGMSQYGAKALADAGATYAEILGHYYGGLQPMAAGGALPETVAVGLVWGADRLTFDIDGPFAVVRGEERVTFDRGGRWLAHPIGGEPVLVSAETSLSRMLDRLGDLLVLL